MNKRIPIALGAAIATVAATTLVITPLSNAADGTGVYAAWTLNSGNATGTGTFTGTVFPGIEFTSKDSSLGVAKSATLTATTPFGEVFGTSRGQQYLTSGVGSGKAEGSLTLNFDTSPIPGTWGLAFGDVDAEDIKVSALGPDGKAVDVRKWKFTPFNYAGGTDLPEWTLDTERILGNGADTSGASMWVEPTSEVSSITLTQIKLSGFPQYQLWVAADILTAAEVTKPVVPDEVCTPTDTKLVNGDFEKPVIPAKSYRQLDQRDVPGWATTATDGKIEIWSTGFGNVTAAEGNQFAEINATQSSELYQTVVTTPGETLTWSLLHRARAAGAIGDTMSVNIGEVGKAPNGVYTFTDTLTEGWVRHTGSYTVPAGQTQTRFGFLSGPTASGNKSIGNFLDDIFFTTTECLPASVSGGNEVIPEISPTPTASPSPSASPSGSTSPSPSASPSGSESVSTSPSPSVSPSPTASPSASPSASPTASPTPTTAETEPEAPKETAKPNVPTVITVDDIPGVDPGSTITDVTPPKNGSAEVRDGDVIYTPNDKFRGEERIAVQVLTPTGETIETTVVVVVGKEQKIVTDWTAPKRLKPGMNWFGPGTFMTNANQPAKVTATCSILLRKVSDNPPPVCDVVAGKEGTYINVKVYEPTGIEVKITAPKKGKYRPLEQKFLYRVNP